MKTLEFPAGPRSLAIAQPLIFYAACDLTGTLAAGICRQFSEENKR
jgi:hypothetical protein